MYSVAIAKIEIPGSVSRLKKLGYSNTVLMADIWPFTTPQNPQQTAEQRLATQAGIPSGTPQVSITTIQAEIQANS